MTAAAFLSGRRSARASQGVSFYGASWLDTLAAWTLALLIAAHAAAAPEMGINALDAAMPQAAEVLVCGGGKP